MKDGEQMNMTNREYYREKFAEDLMSMIAVDPDGLGKLEIFKYLSPSSEQVETGKNPVTGLPEYKETWKISMQDIGGMDADTKEAIRESWAYLMEVKEDGYFDNVDYATLGRDLFMYCFYQLGFDFSPLSFMHLAPTAVKDSIIVERNQSLPIQGFTNYHESKDDVVVWSPSVIGGYERAEEYGANRSIEGELAGNTYQLPDKLEVNDVRKLVEEAKSHPELTFKIDRELSQEEFDLFTHNQVGMDVPSNIRFSQSTLDSVSQDSKEEVSYGRSRTYRQFLNEILDGTEQGLNEDEFAQMWILNHLDNKRFVLDTAIGNKRLKEIIAEQTSQSGNTLRDGMKFRDSITIDISKYQNDNDMAALSNLVKVEAPNRKIQSVTWAPCIKIGNSYYMAESNTDLCFNVTGPGIMMVTYRKVVPWGSSKTIEYDINQKLAPTMRYQTSMNAEPQRNENYVEPLSATSEVTTGGLGSAVQDNRDRSIIENAVATIRNSMASNPDEDRYWNNIISDLLNLNPDDPSLPYSQAAVVFTQNHAGALWRNLSEQQRKSIGNAVREYHRSTVPATQDPIGSVNPEPLLDPSNGNTGGLGALREALEKSIFTEFVNAHEAVGDIVDKENLMRSIQSMEDQDIMDTVEAIRKACRDKTTKVLMLDANGNLMEGC
jgi:hypothetical protein